MSNSDYVWWIDEKLPAAESGSVQAKRLVHYGPYADKDTAERKIEQLRKTARYRKSNLVASEQRGGANLTGQDQHHRRSGRYPA